MAPKKKKPAKARRKRPSKPRPKAARSKAPVPVLPEAPVVEFQEIRTVCSCKPSVSQTISLVDPLCPVHSVLERM